MAILIVIALLIPVLSIAYEKNFNTRPKEDAENSETGIAAEISNMTGADIKDIIRIRNEGNTWNQVLEILKVSDIQDGKAARESSLVENGLDIERLDLLLKEGFTQQDILEARMIVERVVFQLTEIMSENLNTIKKPEAVDLTDASEERYSQLLEKIDISDSVYFMLKLKGILGSIEKALDEYLCSLQLGLNIEEYITNSSKYIEKKKEKSREFGFDSIITISNIEEKMLSKIQIQSKLDEEINQATTSQISSELDDNKSELSVPEPNLPKTEDVKPENPADEIWNEIRNINPLED